MKKQVLFTLSGLAIVLSALLLSSCSKENNGPDNEDPFRLEANLIMGNKLFLNTLDDRNSQNAFEILEVERKNELLEVRVKGSDNAGSFQFIWNGLVQLSFPMGIQLIMQYNGANEDFDTNEEVTVTVNLQKIIGERNNVNEYYFNVINGSKVQTVTLNPNSTTTSEGK